MGGFKDEKEGRQMPLHEGAFTLGHLFQQAGYKTGDVEKWGMGMANATGNHRGQNGYASTRYQYATYAVAAQHPELIPQAIVKREHQPSHLQEWEFADPKFEVKK